MNGHSLGKPQSCSARGIAPLRRLFLPSTFHVQYMTYLQGETVKLLANRTTTACHHYQQQQRQAQHAGPKWTANMVLIALFAQHHYGNLVTTQEHQRGLCGPGAQVGMLEA